METEHLRGDVCSPSHTPQRKAARPKPAAHQPPFPRGLLVAGTDESQDGLFPIQPTLPSTV